MKMLRHRSINTHMKSILLLPSLSSSLSPPRTTIKAFTTLFALPNPSARLLPTPSPPHSRSYSLYPPQNLSLRRTSKPSNFSRNSSRSFGFDFVEAKCVSSISSAHTLEWNEPVPCSEAGDCSIGGVSEEESKPSISVRAYFFSTSVDLRSLVEQNKPNFIPPTSRMTNYVVLRFGNAKAEPNGLGANLTGSDCSYMVVFQYGSIVLFNVRDHEVDDCLKIVRRHASGLLPETRKDDL